MKTLRAVGGLFLAAIAVLAIIAGLSTGTGRQIWNNLWNAVKLTFGWAADQLSKLNVGGGTTGNLPLTIAIAAVAALAVMAISSAARSHFGAVVIAAAILGAFLYNPNLIADLRNA